MSTTALDTTKVEAFAKDLVNTLNRASIALMISVGHRTGLYDAMSEMKPATSPQIASKSGQNERYVREWLGCMVVAGIVEYEPSGTLYRLPAEHAACLTRMATPDNVAAFAQYISLLGSVEDKIVDCFKNGGGVPYSEFGRFHEVMVEDSGQTVVGGLEEHILPIVPGLREKLEQGIEVLDVGCGAGRALNLMADLFPNSRFLGVDFSEEAISMARDNAREKGVTNARFEVKDAADMGYTDAYHLVTTFDAIHDQARPDVVLKEIRKAVKPEGVYLMQDIAGSSHLENNIDHPMGGFLYTVSTMHCMTVSLAQGGMGLGTMWGREKAQEMLAAAGFPKVEVHDSPHDPQNSYYVCRKS